MALEEAEAEKLNIEGLSVMLAKNIDAFNADEDKNVERYLLKSIYDNTGVHKSEKIDEYPKVDMKKVASRIDELARDESQDPKKTFDDLRTWAKVK
ncbi:hypothetical protein [Oenococcus kitaharae]|uniref:Uncharacterized protein n=1 Tax=Oenococcus kitaharae DSM 17330 TaxID=1045004 RepID=G9WF61_9LACO|nr:hypothetical protein [Oenococcus kitaharae]EHN58781.1 hypothetical protein OKIT_0670 [Oenococcus kitaharae DSM 17330]MCV3296761.1 hypothetical protein [Oenococcus kitaharae]OEY81874.1 hypothetical protein NT96_08980 [Oenococcus kitaharae]OEY84103.1 hypothetical protein NT95_03040 [Oenococcus kitaharae]OEY85537.1 hypothetical protein NV75_03395 [Oenococcus kitaharae]